MKIYTQQNWKSYAVLQQQPSTTASKYHWNSIPNIKSTRARLVEQNCKASENSKL